MIKKTTYMIVLKPAFELPLFPGMVLLMRVSIPYLGSTIAQQFTNHSCHGVEVKLYSQYTAFAWALLSNINSWPTTNPTTAAFIHLIHHHLKSQRPSISSKTWFPQLDTPSYFMPTRANKTRGSKCPSHWWLWKNQFQGQPEYILS